MKAKEKFLLEDWVEVLVPRWRNRSTTLPHIKVIVFWQKHARRTRAAQVEHVVAVNVVARNGKPDEFLLVGIAR